MYQNKVVQPIEQLLLVVFYKSAYSNAEKGLIICQSVK